MTEDAVCESIPIGLPSTMKGAKKFPLGKGTKDHGPNTTCILLLQAKWPAKKPKEKFASFGFQTSDKTLE